MKKALLICLLSILVSLLAEAQETKWLTNLEQAKPKAKAENKAVMLVFTGSDWCKQAVQCREEMFSKPEFIAYASTNLVLVEIDFPRSKTQTAEQSKSNKELKEAFKVKGFPTFALLDGEGKEIARRLGYNTETPNNFMNRLILPRKVREAVRATK